MYFLNNSLHVSEGRTSKYDGASFSWLDSNQLTLICSRGKLFRWTWPKVKAWAQVGFPHSLVGKESACNVGDPSLISGSGRYPGEGIGYPLQYSWAPLVAQLVKNLPAMWETWVQSLGWEDPLDKGKAITPVFWPGEFHGLYSPWDRKESDTTEQISLSSIIMKMNGGRVHPCLVLDLRKDWCFSTIKHDIKCRFSVGNEDVSPLLICWEFLAWMDIEFCRLIFLYILMWLCHFSSLVFDVMDCINWFSAVETDLHTWSKFHFVMVHNSPYTLLDSICLHLLKIFASMFIRDSGLQSSFLAMSGFGSNAGLKE